MGAVAFYQVPLSSLLMLGGKPSVDTPLVPSSLVIVHCRAMGLWNVVKPLRDFPSLLTAEFIPTHESLPDVLRSIFVSFYS